MTGNHSTDEFDASERGRIRNVIEIVVGNGEIGLVERMSRAEQSIDQGKRIFWAVIALAAIHLATFAGQVVMDASRHQPAKIVIPAEEVAADLP